MATEFPGQSRSWSEESFKGLYARHLDFLARNRTVFPSEEAKNDFYRYIELWNTSEFWEGESNEFYFLRAKLKSLRLLPDYRKSTISLTGSVMASVGEKIVRLIPKADRPGR